MKFALAAILLLWLTACSTPRYHYVPTTINALPYAHAGEGHLGIAFGTVGIAVKGGIAVSDNININGYFGGMPESDNGYTSRESEFSVGVQTNPGDNTVGSFSLGMGIGNNEKDKIGLSGNYNRPFFQAQFAAYDKPLFNSGVHFDGYIGLRVNYLDYNGLLSNKEFDDHLFFYEPYFGVAIGGRNVRLEILQGFSVKNSGEWGDGVRVFPYFASVGLMVKLRKSPPGK